MNEPAPVANSATGNYPPIYYYRLQYAALRWWVWFTIISALFLLAGASFIWDWHNPLMPFAPFLGALWIYSVLVAWFSRREGAIACVLPHFPKKSPRVNADTLLSGHALARNFQVLEQWAKDGGITPLSTFGWADDLLGATVVWHEAARGLETVALLLEHPELSADVRDDLEKLQDALQKAQAVGTPFCLLLRHGNGASGAEMDARQGTFF